MIRIKGARHNNLKNIDIELPHNTFICVTGVSGSGKSSLVYDIIARESRRRFFETYSAHIRQYMQRLSRPDVDEISGLKPVLTINQHTAVSNPRSTLGTYTGIYDLFRLLYARCGEKTGDQNVPLSRSLFSFHAPPGACPACEGIGTEYYIDPEMLIEDANKSLREGCMSITTPNGYIMYSQVTLDVLNEVCVVNGFSIDIPWNQLTEADKHVVLYGSENIIIPFGKHTLESRMTWTGITAKPREEGFYKGIIPVMQVILNREKNPGILRFCKTITCRKCSGKRLSDAALSVSFKGKDIAELNALSLEAIHSLFTTHLSHKISEVDAAISNEILKKTSAIMSLGLGYLSPSRLTSSLSGGEVQRLRLANLADSKITNVLFVLDEPGAGLHPDEVSSVIQIIENLVARGNSVIAVEHNLQIIGRASYIIELGPEAGDKGGEVVFSGPASEFFNHQNKITTRSWVCGEKFREIKPLQPPGDEKISIINADLQNLRKVSVEFCKRAINLVTGISGSGRKSLVGGVLCGSIQAEAPVGCDEIRGVENMQLVNISQNPIGKTPRSNAATYTKVFDEIRDLFARQPVAKAKRFGKSRFSFNVKGGRCEKCEGAGVISVGMHFLGTMHSICPGCEGKRFNDETLTVQYRGNNISEVLEMKVEEALGFFTHENKITAVLKVLKDIGLGYLSLGQPSTTLSGGEAQRIKLATELARKTAGEKLFVINHPTIGLHADDAVRLLEILKRLTELGHTVIAIEHHPVFLAGAAHIVELGMDSDNNSGYLIAQGPVSAFLKLSHSAIGRFLSKLNSDDASFVVKSQPPKLIGDRNITFRGVSTNNLRNIDITIPENKITLLTGISGSGKSSIAYDTVFSAGSGIFTENLSTYVRSMLPKLSQAEYEDVKNIRPAVALKQGSTRSGKRSTLGTYTEVYDLLRLLFARGNDQNETLLSSVFSFNHEKGACIYCDGLGYQLSADPDVYITNPEFPLINGALQGTKTGSFYGDPSGQYVNTLIAVGKSKNIDFSVAWNQLDEDARKIATLGTGEEKYDVEWHYDRKGRTGTHKFSGVWKGFSGYINDEYARKHADARADIINPLMKEQKCSDCNGYRLNRYALSFTYNGLNIGQISAMPVRDLHEIISSQNTSSVGHFSSLYNSILNISKLLLKISLGGLPLDRPTDCLSAGEFRKLQMLRLLKTDLSGMICVFDELSLGLEADEIAVTAGFLREIKAKGNTVLVIDHSPLMVDNADFIIETGPGAGSSGGEIVDFGTREEILSRENLTSRYYWKLKEIVEKQSLIPADGNSQKEPRSDLHFGAIYLVRGRAGTAMLKGMLRKYVGNTGKFSKVVFVDSSTARASSGSLVSTYSGIHSLIAEEFAAIAKIQQFDFSSREFLFGSKSGSCNQCSGLGKVRFNMDFLPDLWVECPVCEGRMYRSEVLQVLRKGKSITDILRMEMREAAIEFADIMKIAKSMKLSAKLGIDYLKMNQLTSELSGGEFQRLYLLREIRTETSGHVLYLMDNPTAGLHPFDVEQLVLSLSLLTDGGHTVVIGDNNAFLTGLPEISVNWEL